MNKPNWRKFVTIIIATFLISGIAAIACNPITPRENLKIAAISAQTIPPTLFGMHIEHSYKIPYPTIPFASWRLWDVHTEPYKLVFWPHLEPQPDNWDFTGLDQIVELAQKHQVELVYTFGLTPDWAATRPEDPSHYGEAPSPSEPKNIADWRDFVQTIATRYKGKIRYYELWNEPNLNYFYTGTIDQMVTLAQEAYTILKQIDPEIQVISPSVIATHESWLTKPGNQWLDEYFRKGGKAYTDIVAAHFYLPAENTPEDRINPIQEIQAVMAKHELTDKPLWNTETGFGNRQQNHYYSDAESQAYVARSYLIYWSAGVERFYWYGWDNRNVLTMLMVEPDNRTLTPAAKAYQEIQNWLVGAKMQPCSPEKNHTWTCQLNRNGENSWIVWNPKNEIKFEIPQNWNVSQVTDLNGQKSPLPTSESLQVGQLPLLLTQN
ncbi:MAG: hypothetical protein SAJ37_07495 [Oscillatoria sp. PMC 1068.18]|nr:hypothetical protein [Oscillatoria sp. PMC 1076.18]MEC4988578.1 hypothetical protein [Oscillatoria sp. PMC 1068.18]